jgi:hypothetical protein
MTLGKTTKWKDDWNFEFIILNWDVLIMRKYQQ